MTNEEKTLLIAYLIDAGEQDPDGDLKAEFLGWRQAQPGAGRGDPGDHPGHQLRRPGHPTQPGGKK